jgi:hypothetical protein
LLLGKCGKRRNNHTIKFKPTPITEAISKWLEKRKGKLENQKVEDVEIKTYQDYKEQNNKK